MLFLARFILKGQSQAALVAVTMAVLGLILPLTAWISAATIVLVTLVHGSQRGLITMALSLAGVALFAYLIFAPPYMPEIFELWKIVILLLLAWSIAKILQQTVSLAYSLQVLTAICLLAIVLVYALYPDFGEFWREQLNYVLIRFAEQSNEFSPAELKQTEDWTIKFLPGFLVCSIMLGAMLSLLLGRWWQAVFYNPGGFAKEFQSLNLGKISALVAIAIMLIAMFANSVFAIALVTVVFVLYGMQALSLLHAAIKIRQLNATWLLLIYLIMLFIPQLLLMLILMSFADPWLNIRQRIGLSV